jgi:hypothetical protein
MEPERGQQRGIFDSFRPAMTAPERNALARETISERGIDRHNAVIRYAKSGLDIDRMLEQDLPVLPHQRHAQERARVALDAIRPHASRDLDSAFERDSALAREAADGRTQRAIRAMQLEAEVRNDPELRADRFVERWQKLDRERIRHDRSGDWQSEYRIRDSMGEMARGLERDAQMESILRNRSRDLSVSMPMEDSFTRDLMRYLGLSLGRGLGL